MNVDDEKRFMKNAENILNELLKHSESIGCDTGIFYDDGFKNYALGMLAQHISGAYIAGGIGACLQHAAKLHETDYWE